MICSSNSPFTTSCASAAIAFLARIISWYAQRYLCLCSKSSLVALISKNNIMYAFLIATCVLHVRSSYPFFHPNEDAHNINFLHPPDTPLLCSGDQTKYVNCHITNPSPSLHCTPLIPLRRYTVHRSNLTRISVRN